MLSSNFIIDLMKSDKLKNRGPYIKYTNNILSVAYEKRNAWKSTNDDVKIFFYGTDD